jgi:hypothetical protein
LPTVTLNGGFPTTSASLPASLRPVMRILPPASRISTHDFPAKRNLRVLPDSVTATRSIFGAGTAGLGGSILGGSAFAATFGGSTFGGSGCGFGASATTGSGGAMGAFTGATVGAGAAAPRAGIGALRTKSHQYIPANPNTSNTLATAVART